MKNMDLTSKSANEYSYVIILTARCINWMNPTILVWVVQNCAVLPIFPFNVSSYFVTISRRLLGTSEILSPFAPFSSFYNKLVDGISMSSINFSRCKARFANSNKRFHWRQWPYDFSFRTVLIESSAMIFASERR